MSEKVLVLKSGVCSWARCCFCGYGRIAGREPSLLNLKNAFDPFLSSLQTGDVVKVYGSGSFLDIKQVPKEARKYFIEGLREKGIKKLFIESRPEHVKKEALDDFSGMDLSVAIGLEVADDAVLDKVKKGFHLRDYESAAGLIHSSGCKVKTYLLVNPPYVKDMRKSLDSSVEYALKHSDELVLINLLPHGNTEVFRMWLLGQWNYLSREEFFSVTEKYRNDARISLDVETFGFVPKFPKEVAEPLKGVGEDYLTHPHFEVWQDYLQRWYRPDVEKDLLLFLPCSYSKPYSQSETHRAIISVLREDPQYNRIHQVMLSNAGVIPREYENYYPFNSYDWDERLETEEIKKRYIEVTMRRIEGYLSAHKDYKKIMCYLKYSSESYQALEKACVRLNLSCTNLLNKETYEKIKGQKKMLQTADALEDLKRGLREI